MQLLVNPASYSNALELIDLNVHQIFIGDSQFSVRNNCCLKLKEIKSLCDLKKETKILILINRFFFDHELEQLENYILEISKLKIDGIIFSDFAVNQICYEHKIKIPLIYCSETLVTNHEQFPFYFDNNIQEVSLARELNRNEIKEICKHKNQMKLQMQADGHVYVMHSRWGLISNFQNAQNIKTSLLNTKLSVREVTRKEPMLIYEDKNGTHILTGYCLRLIKHIRELSDYGIDTIRIDSFLHDANWTLQTTKMYLHALKQLTDFTDNDIPNVQLSKNECSCGFYLMNREDLIYLNQTDIKGEYE